MTHKTNFMHGSTDEAEEIHAYKEICEYLIKQGKYSSFIEADNDAIERVENFDSLGIYNEEPQLIDASIHRKKTHALIYAHDLHGVIGGNNGFLPDPESDSAIDVNQKNKLIDIVNAEVSSGSSRESVVEKLILSGFEPDKAETFVDTIISSRENHFAQVAKYVAFSAIFFFAWFWSLTYIYNKEELMQIAKYDFLAFIVLMFMFVLLSKVGGKIFAYLRYCTSFLFWLSAATLSGLLFLQEPWVESSLSAGVGKAAILASIINIVISIGPLWIGVIFGVLSMAILMLAWAEYYKIKEGIFKVED